MCEKFLQLLAVGRWFPPGTPVSSTRKLISSFHRLDMTMAVAEALNPNKPNQTICAKYSLGYVTGHIKDPMPLIEKRRGLSPGGRFPPSFIHQVIIITGLNKLYNCMFSPWRWP